MARFSPSHIEYCVTYKDVVNYVYWDILLPATTETIRPQSPPSRRRARVSRWRNAYKHTEGLKYLLPRITKTTQERAASTHHKEAASSPHTAFYGGGGGQGHNKHNQEKREKARYSMLHKEKETAEENGRRWSN